MTTSDLAWDYTGDENSPLLISATDDLRRSERKCILTQRQVLHLMHNLREVSQILNYETRRNSTAFVRPTHQVEDVEQNPRGFLSFIHRQFSKINVSYLYLTLVLLLLCSLVVDSIIDATQSPCVPYTSIVASCFASAGLVIIYLIFLLRIKIQRKIPCMMHLICSYVVTALLFASLFTAFPCSRVAEKVYNPSPHILKYLNNLQVSVCLMALSYYGQLQPSCWNSLLLISVQAILSYWHLVLILLRLLPFALHRPDDGVCVADIDNIQFSDRPSPETRVPFDDASSYTFNQNRNLYGSIEVLERNPGRVEDRHHHSCPVGVPDEHIE